MSEEKSKGRGRDRGRPRVANEPVAVTVRIDASMVEMADGIAADLDRLGLPGMRNSRGEVMRAALVRGIEAMRVDVNARLEAQKPEG